MTKYKHILLMFLFISFIFLFIEYNQYIDNKRELMNFNNEYQKIYEKENENSITINNLKLEKENISKEKEKQLELYEKWKRQNKVLEDLLK